jgi:murein DD-endopeptidase MepM/ murein hydrolase activator NlpD
MRCWYWYALGCLAWLLASSCSSTAPGIFGRQSFHEQYGKKLADAGLKETALGRQWFAAAESALQQPVSITIPYKEVGYFSAEKPRAVGIKFTAKRGQQITIQLSKRSSVPFVLYADVWNATPKPALKATFDTTQQTVTFEADGNGDYILRLQPELLSSGEYTVAVVAGASLGFPVAGAAARIGSTWGDARDAGARKHEGIDIFAPKRTPAVAAADGVVTTVNENALGGKVVWLRPRGKDYVLYYAHLDEQLVQEQQRVRQGDTLGLIGNTGNARTTPAHLHFGIYAVGGAIDPLPFVNPAVKNPPDVDTQLFQKAIRLTTSTPVVIGETTRLFKPQTVATPVARNAAAYRALFPDGTLGIVPVKATQNAAQSLRTITVKDTVTLLEQPSAQAISKQQVVPVATVALLGYFNGFALVQTKDGDQGWVYEKEVR